MQEEKHRDGGRKSQLITQNKRRWSKWMGTNSNLKKIPFFAFSKTQTSLILHSLLFNPSSLLQTLKPIIYCSCRILYRVFSLLVIFFFTPFFNFHLFVERHAWIWGLWVVGNFGMLWIFEVIKGFLEFFWFIIFLNL